MGDYTPQATPSAQPVPPADSVFVPSPVQDSVPVDPNRPISTIPADPMATASTTPVPDNPDLHRPEPTVSADLLEATHSADETPPVQPSDADARMQTQSNPMPSEPPADSPFSPVSPQAPQVPLAPELSASPSSEPIDQGSIKEPSGVPEPSQVQSNLSEPASGLTAVQPSETKTKSAEIAPETSQVRQEAPSADSQPEVAPKQSFGDLISSPQPPPLQDQSSPSPVPPTPPAPPSAEAEPSSLPDLSIPSIPSIPPTPLQPEQSISVGTGTPDLSEKRKQAVQARKQKVADRLEKIVTFVSQKGKASNRDIRDVLHVSQTTVSDYCHTLVSSGKLKREGKAKATTYSLP